jgi:copper(I)-binding protein
MHRGSRALLAIVAIAIVIVAAQPAAAHDYTLGDLRIGNPWTRATAAPGGAGGGYLTIRNTGSEPDRLLRAETAAAANTELHTMSMEGGVMRMRPVAGIVIPPGQEVRLAPGGLHVMFLNTRERFVQGQKITARLVFERAGSIEVEFHVQAPGARGSGHHH